MRSVFLRRAWWVTFGYVADLKEFRVELYGIRRVTRITSLHMEHFIGP